MQTPLGLPNKSEGVGDCHSLPHHLVHFGFLDIAHVDAREPWDRSVRLDVRYEVDMMLYTGQIGRSGRLTSYSVTQALTVLLAVGLRMQ